MFGPREGEGRGARVSGVSEGVPIRAQKALTSPHRQHHHTKIVLCRGRDSSGETEVRGGREGADGLVRSTLAPRNEFVVVWFRRRLKKVEKGANARSKDLLVERARGR